MPPDDIELSGEKALALGAIPGGRLRTAGVNVRGPRGFSAKVWLDGANAGDVTLVLGRSEKSGPGPHELAASGRAARIGLLIEPPVAEGDFAATLHVERDGTELTAELTGTIEVFSIEASQGFGAVQVGESRERSVVIANRAGEAIDVTLTPPASPFTTTSPGTVSVPARGQLPVAVTFEPSAIGAASGTLSATHEGATKDCSLAGEGIQRDFEEAAGVDPDDEDAGASTPGASGTAGDYQRLYLHVPTKNTNVSFGKEYDAALHDPTHAGYSAMTEGHVLVRNRTAERSMTFQAKDQVWCQSTTADVFLGAGDGGISMVSAGGTYLSSGKGVVLAAGHGDIGTLNEFDSGAEPPVPAVAAIGDAMSDVALGWTVANTAIAGVGLVYGVTRSTLAVKNLLKGFRVNQKWKDPLSLLTAVPIAGTIRNAVLTGMSLHDTINKNAKLNRDPVLPTESINMYAEGGFLAGTYGYTSIYGATGVALRSLNAAVLGLMTCGVDSLAASGMFGFQSAGMSSIHSVTIEGGLKAKLGSPSGALDVKGPDIQFESTGGTKVSGGDGVNVAAPTMATKAKVLAAQGAQVQASAKTNVVMAVGSAYGVEITPAGVTVGSRAGVAVDPTKPHLKIGPDGVTIFGGPAGPVQLQIGPAMVMAKSGGTTFTHMGQTLFSLAPMWELA